MDDAAPRVVIVGAGFGGLRAARALRRAAVRVTLVDRHNYHLFQPLLYQVATAGLSPEDIAYPVRAILRRQRNAAFRLAEVADVDFEARRLHTSSGAIDYERLILAMGGSTHFFGLDSVERNGLPLKDIRDAVAIRNHVLRTFELGVQEPDPDRRRAMLTLAVVGGGPTGVESAGALSELIRLVLTRDFPQLDVKDVRVILLEATDRMLADFPAKLREYAGEALWHKHVEVRYGARVTDFDGSRVELQGGECIPAHTLLWAAGVRAAPLADGLGCQQGPLGRLRVRPTLQLLEHEDVFVIGDAAWLEAERGGLPMMAPVAQQQAETAAANVLRSLGGKPLEDFRYRDPGSLATIGRTAAVARLGRLQLTGFPAWLVWLVFHIWILIGFRNRLVVLINWAWDYLLYDRAVRLITEPEGSAAEASPVMRRA
ncbi:MAG: NAD(P)/FAD-dependent oxidoreductase [Myxococcota bacterium]